MKSFANTAILTPQQMSRTGGGGGGSGLPRPTPLKQEGLGFVALLQALQEGRMEDEDDDVVQCKLREAIVQGIRAGPVILASIEVAVAIGTQQLMVLESSSSSSPFSPSYLPAFSRDGSNQRQPTAHSTQALVLQVGMGLNACLVPVFEEEGEGEEGEEGSRQGENVVKHVTGKLKATGHGWQVTLQRLS
eukprot:evm.model.NODE_42081_length_29725_cov_28.437342.1